MKYNYKDFDGNLYDDMKNCEIVYKEYLKNPDDNHFNAGFSDQEREKFTCLLDAGFIDTYRYLYPSDVKYSWWSYRTRARERNIGWRIDYIVVSKRFMEKVEDSLIYDDIYGSDHCPVGLIVKEN